MANGTSQGAIKVGDGTGVVAGGRGDDVLIAEPQVFTASFQAVNGSGVSGSVRVNLNADGLRVQADVSGLEPEQNHPLHVHGLNAPGHTPEDSLPPTASLDIDHDGFIELQEARQAGGPVLMDLGSPAVGADGTLHFDQTFSLHDLPGLSAGNSLADLLPLDFRSVEIHGLSVPAGAGAGTSGEVDGSGGYKPVLPVATASLHAEGATPTAPSGAGIPGAFVLGGNGDDRLIGGHGDDVLVGGRGNDVLAGGQGDDDLVGGSGADRFLVGQGKDVITDFHPSEGDRLVFSHDVQSAALVLHDTKQGTWIIAGDGAVEDPASQGVLLLGLHVHAPSEAAGWFA
ncbi:MAG TPA: hypothetical protein VK196_10430 [Magnetospirillum sp.]|nr:hypothetical protein [Magnetospirillum sp.]